MDLTLVLPQRSRGQWLAYLALAFGILCIGCSAIFVKLAGVPGPVSAFYRVLIASLVLLPWWLGSSAPRPDLRNTLWIVAGGVLFALDLVLWNSALLLTTAATATLLANNAPLWVGLGALLLFGERLGKRYWLGLAISLAGMGLIVGSDAWHTLSLNLGDLMAIGASLFYAGYLLTTQRARERVDTLSFMTLSVGASALFLLPFNLLLGQPLSGFSADAWTALLGLGLVSQLGGWLSINYALGHLRATNVSVTLLAQALVTALLSIPLLGEFLSIGQIAGGALVLGGIYLVNRRNAAT